ncbi:hypothetical protein ACTJLD_30415 [Burkholderia sp. 22088]|uniref:hypothetical protein n=1 Tax=Burkholderia sp. 22088 TaxID=3453871 RepID=UPI003F835ED9
MKSEDTRGWTTQAEFDFIDQLASRMNAISLLQGYLAGMTRRTEFCGIDPTRATRYAHDRLDTMLRKFAA